MAGLTAVFAIVARAVANSAATTITATASPGTTVQSLSTGGARVDVLKLICSGVQFSNTAAAAITFTAQFFVTQGSVTDYGTVGVASNLGASTTREPADLTFLVENGHQLQTSPAVYLDTSAPFSIGLAAYASVASDLTVWATGGILLEGSLGGVV